MGLIRSLFSVGPAAEVAIELDPAALDEERAAALGQMRITRASLGVQDFDDAVQAAIGRPQSFEATRDAAAAARAAGARSLNLDLIYGLPHQSVASVERTAALALELAPDRISVFGYAHVPWMKRHQALIAEAALPGPGARFAQMLAIGAVLRDGGFVPVGLDHYARPEDAMAKAAAAGRLRRNFQGYTTDDSETLIGIGASAIGALAQGYAQNAAGVPAYTAAIHEGRFAVERGVALSLEDRMRRAVIERIMCDMAVDLPGEAAAWGMEAAPLLEAAAGLGRFVRDGLARWDGARLEVTAPGRPFLRNVAALFDAYLAGEDAAPRHAKAV
jgi:oxygen-independent coproporphyrinogen-3 oxidase